MRRTKHQRLDEERHRFVITRRGREWLGPKCSASLPSDDIVSLLRINDARPAKARRMITRHCMLDEIDGNYVLATARSFTAIQRP